MPLGLEDTKNFKGKIYSSLQVLDTSRLIFLLIILILFAVAFILDLSVYLSYHTPKNFTLIILTAAGLLIFWLQGKRLLGVSWLEILLLIRLVWVVITNPALLYHPSNLGFWILLSLLILTLLSRQVAANNPNFLTYFFRALWVIGLVQALIGLYQFTFLKDYPSHLMKTAMIGTIGTANGYGLFLAVSIIAALTDQKYLRNRIGRNAVRLSAFLMIIALLLNQSRGALLGLISAVLIVVLFILFTRENRFGILPRIHLPRIVFIAALIVCFLIFGFVLYQLNPESSIGRFMEWRISAPMILDHPIMGVGHGRFAVEYLNYQSRYFENPEHNCLAYKAVNIKQAHSEYLQAFCESGIFGGLLFLVIWSFALWNIFHYLHQNRNSSWQYYGLALIVLTILIHAMVDMPLHVLPISVVAYMALGLIPVKESLIKKIVFKSGLSRLLITIILFLYTLFIVGKSIYQYPGYIHWNQGVIYAHDHHWGGAIGQYQAALKRLPGEGELQLHLGSAMAISGSYSKGIYYLKESLNNFNDKNIYLSLSYAYLHLKNYDEAEKYARIALSRFPDHLAPHLLLGEIYYYRGKIEDSKASLIKCINRQTTIQSDDIAQIASDARQLWERFYGK